MNSNARNTGSHDQQGLRRFLDSQDSGGRSREYDPRRHIDQTPPRQDDDGASDRARRCRGDPVNSSAQRLTLGDPKVSKAEKITDADDLKAAQAQAQAVAKSSHRWPLR